MVICLERDADLHCFSKVQIGFTFLVLAHPGSPGQRDIKRVCVCVCVCVVIVLRHVKSFVLSILF